MFMKTENTLVTIIVPNYNHEKYLKQRLHSIFNQTYPNFEVILLDDCSTDNSRTILSEYASNRKVSHCVFNEINTGNTFVQWNKGIALAKGEFIWIAESDDFCDANFLQEVLKPLIENRDVVLSYCQSNRVNENGVVTGSWKTQTDNLDSDFFNGDFVIDGNLFIEKYLIYKNVIPNASAVVFRKQRSAEIEYLSIDSILRYSGDWLFYFRLIVNNKISFISKSLNDFRYHSESAIATAVKTQNRVAFLEITLKIRQKMYACLCLELPYNFKAITKLNKSLGDILIYKKAFHFIGYGQRLKGILILLTVLDVFIKEYKFKIFFQNRLEKIKNLFLKKK